MFRISITTGKTSAISRPARIAVSVRFALASPKRSTSCGSRTNARTTRMPVICSRSTRFTPSMFTCILRNCGTIRLAIRPIDAASNGTATATSQDSPTSSRTAMKMPPTMVIGAATSIVQVITTSICTWVTSLVLREISVGAPNWFTSRAENSPTRWKTAARTSRPNSAAVLAPKYTATIVQMICTRLTPSIQPPVRTM